ncbi:unnamed protein product, partial [Onchocerca flexuosa]|uniref:G_PROTEIN_RECEP_F1_2 domain-containing protein n=1 Tax=Onchocerca flexuosa TaxID=387005 RepID=A0A183HBK0_9BILA
MFTTLTKIWCKSNCAITTRMKANVVFTKINNLNNFLEVITDSHTNRMDFDPDHPQWHLYCCHLRNGIMMLAGSETVVSLIIFLCSFIYVSRANLKQVAFYIRRHAMVYNGVDVAYLLVTLICRLFTFLSFNPAIYQTVL